MEIDDIMSAFHVARENPAATPAELATIGYELAKRVKALEALLSASGKSTDAKPVK